VGGRSKLDVGKCRGIVNRNKLSGVNNAATGKLGKSSAKSFKKLKTTFP